MYNLTVSIHFNRYSLINLYVILWEPLVLLFHCNHNLLFLCGEVLPFQCRFSANTNGAKIITLIKMALLYKVFQPWCTLSYNLKILICNIIILSILCHCLWIMLISIVLIKPPQPHSTLTWYTYLFTVIK